jgi:hypothetical protein
MGSGVKKTFFSRALKLAHILVGLPNFLPKLLLQAASQILLEVDPTLASTSQWSWTLPPSSPVRISRNPTTGWVRSRPTSSRPCGSTSPQQIHSTSTRSRISVSNRSRRRSTSRMVAMLAPAAACSTGSVSSGAQLVRVHRVQFVHGLVGPAFLQARRKRDPQL